MSTVSLEDIPAQSFTDETVLRMYRLIDKAKTDTKFQELVYGIVNKTMHGQWKDYKRELSTVFDFFKRTIDYRRDPHNVELLQDVWRTLDVKRADCDDFTILIAAAAEVLGSPSRIVTVSTRQDKQPSHVYAQANVGGRWQGLDCIMPYSYVGWEPESVTAKRIWSRTDVGLEGYDKNEPLEGLGMLGEFFTTSTPSGFSRAEKAAILGAVDDAVKAGFVKTPEQAEEAAAVAAGVIQRNDRTMPDNVQSNGPWERGFAMNMFRVPSPDGAPYDAGHTWSGAHPGELMESTRLQPSKMVAETADQAKSERPGGGAYNPAFPIISHRLPGENFATVDSRDVPMPFNPDVFTGTIPSTELSEGTMFPGPLNPMRDYTRDLDGLAGLGSHKGGRAVHHKPHQEYVRVYGGSHSGAGWGSHGHHSQGLEGLGSLLSPSILSAISGAMGDVIGSGAVSDNDGVNTAIQDIIKTAAAVEIAKMNAADQAAAIKQATAAAQAAAAARLPGYKPPSDIPSWVLPVGIGVAALTLFGVIAARR